MIKHGTPEPIEPVQEHDEEAQGINVTAARETPSSTTRELLDEGEEWGSANR